MKFSHKNWVTQSLRRQRESQRGDQGGNIKEKMKFGGKWPAETIQYGCKKGVESELQLEKNT